MWTPPNIAVAVLGLLNLAYGLWALFAPAAAAALSDFQLVSPKAAGEFRTVYGGLVLGLGGAMVGGLWVEDPAGWWRALACLFAGLVLGRCVSAVADGPSVYTLGLGALEAGCGAVLWWAAKPFAPH